MFPRFTSLHVRSALGQLRALFALSLLAISVAAQSQPLNNDDIIKMVKSNFSEEMILRVIESTDGAFDTSVQSLLKLKQAGVGEKTIGAMLKAKTPGPAAAPAPTQSSRSTDEQQTASLNAAALKPGAKPAPKGQLKPEIKPEGKVELRASAKPEVQTSTVGFELPTEEGVYLVERGQLVELFPEVVNWKTGGALKGMASMGLTKGHINGTVRNPHSRRQTGAPLEIIIRCPAGVAPTEYQLLDLWEKDNRREFRARTGGVIHASAGAQKNALEFDPVKIGPSTYKITLKDLKKGEYGFLAPGWSGANMAASGKIHTFGIE